MKLISWNVNGLRAIARKGFQEWFEAQDADLVCLQETRAQPHQLSGFTLCPPGYHAHFCSAQKPGYSSVATYSKQEPVRVSQGMDFPEVDVEGRILVTVYPQFTMINAYMPHSRRDLSRLDYKMAFCARFLPWLNELKQAGHRLIICGDYNTAHTDLDLTHFKANRKNAGFLPVERAWMDDFLALGFRDVFRDQHPEQTGHYTWWSNIKGVRERNVGWRIDYFLVDEALVPLLHDASLQPQVRGSDHCPVVIELNLP